MLPCIFCPQRKVARSPGLNKSRNRNFLGRVSEIRAAFPAALISGLQRLLLLGVAGALPNRSGAAEPNLLPKCYACACAAETVVRSDCSLFRPAGFSCLLS
jgi:hypothetical protein